MKTEYQIIVETNSYAGNFERELCAFMTGQVGECGVGSELAEKDIEESFDGKINSKPDDNGYYRPVALHPEDANNMIIFLSDRLEKSDVDFLTERAKLFEETRPYEYLHKDFKFLGLKQVMVTGYKTVEEV